MLIAWARILASERGCEPTGSHQKNFFSSSDKNSLGRPLVNEVSIAMNLARAAKRGQPRRVLAGRTCPSNLRLHVRKGWIEKRAPIHEFTVILLGEKDSTNDKPLPRP